VYQHNLLPLPLLHRSPRGFQIHYRFVDRFIVAAIHQGILLQLPSFHLNHTIVMMVIVSITIRITIAAAVVAVIATTSYSYCLHCHQQTI
jgi:hypothetical protein